MIPIEKLGRDHWSTFAYIGCTVVGQGGKLQFEKMRCDVDRHPGFSHAYSPFLTTKYPTTLRDGSEILNHDDWDCADDLVTAGLLKWNGTGLNPCFELTDSGWNVFRQLTQHRNGGKSFGTFEPRVT